MADTALFSSLNLFWTLCLSSQGPLSETGQGLPAACLLPKRPATVPHAPPLLEADTVLTKKAGKQL